MDYKIEKAGEKDTKRIWEIRNHPLVRKNSGNTGIISLKNHQEWFKNKYLSNENNFCFIIKDNSENFFGYCRYDFDEKKEMYIISIAMDPEKQGRGLGSLLLSQSLKQVKKIPILAKIKKNNIASIKLFEKNGFCRGGENHEGFDYLIEL